MNELIKIETRAIAGATVQTCNARDLWEFVESRAQFADWIKGRVEKYGFVEGEDYLVQKILNNPAGGRPTLDYHLTIETAKELAMVENNERGRQVRRYFIDCERRAKEIAPVAASLTRLQLIEIAMQAETERLALEGKVKELAPMAEALTQIARSEGGCCITLAAKTLQRKPRSLIALLMGWGWIYRHAGGKLTAYQEVINRGYLEHKVGTVEARDGTDKAVWNVIVTPKGLARLAMKLGVSLKGDLFDNPMPAV